MAIDSMPVDAQRSRAVFQKLDRDLQKLRSTPEAKSVHHFRTRTSRLQILLENLAPSLGRNEKKLLHQLAKLRKRAGKLRDLDLQLASLRSLKTPREPRRKTQLIHRLIELRCAQEKKLHKAATPAAIREIRKRLQRAAKNFDAKSARDAFAAARSMLAKLQSTGEALSEPLLHEFRILTKRARYAAEFAKPSPEVTHFIADLKKIQDALGDWHDWSTLTQTSIKHLGEVEESPLVAELHNVTGAKYRHAVAIVSHLRGAKPSQKITPRATPAIHIPAA